MKHVLNTLLFTIVVPATFAGWLPLRLRGHAQASSSLLLVSLSTFFDRHRNRNLPAHGFLAPIAPTKRLVVDGLHHYVRNPIYLGVLLIVIGQAVLFRSTTIFFYGGVIWLAAHMFVLFYEEPTLERKFGEEYREYRQRVPRWVPRF